MKSSISVKAKIATVSLKYKKGGKDEKVKFVFSDAIFWMLGITKKAKSWKDFGISIDETEHSRADLS